MNRQIHISQTFNPRRLRVGLASYALLGLVLGCTQTTTSSIPTANPAPQDSTVKLACSSPHVTKSVGEIAVGQATGTYSEPYVQWGIEQGCFAKFGLTVQNLAGVSEAARTAGLTGGSMDIVIQSPRIVVTAAANSEFAPLIVSSHSELSQEKLDEALAEREFRNRFLVDQTLISSPTSGIESLKELNGARIGVASVRGSGVTGLRRIAESEGIDFETIEFVELDQQESVNALLRGDLDAATLTPALALSVIQEGGHFLGHPAVLALMPGSQFVWVTTQEIYAEKPAEIDAFRRGMWEVYSLMEQESYQEEMVDFLVARYGLDEELKDMVPLPEFTPRQVTLEEVQQWVPELLSRGDIEREVAFDRSILLPLN